MGSVSQCQTIDIRRNFVISRPHAPLDEEGGGEGGGESDVNGALAVARPSSVPEKLDIIMSDAAWRFMWEECARYVSGNVNRVFELPFCRVWRSLLHLCQCHVALRANATSRQHSWLRCLRD